MEIVDPEEFLTYVLKVVAVVASATERAVWSIPTVIAVVPDAVIGAVPETPVT